MLALRMVAVKNSMKRLAALSPGVGDDGGQDGAASYCQPVNFWCLDQLGFHAVVPSS